MKKLGKKKEKGDFEMKQKQNLLKKEENRGITLVALVVTIVVVLNCSFLAMVVEV